MGLFNLFKKRDSKAQKTINEEKKEPTIYNITKLKDSQKISLFIFGKERELDVFSSGDSSFDESGNYKTEVEFNKEELELLNWLLNNIKLEDYAQEITNYCNYIYSLSSDIKINKEDISKEVTITSIAISVRENFKAYDGSEYPEISFYGECQCDEDHGICIGFRDKKLIGIHNQDWVL